MTDKLLIDRLISGMEAVCVRGEATAVDAALWHALRLWRDKLPELDGYFHKAFRQCDVLGNGDADMVMWHLLDGSELFWKVFNGEFAADGKQEET